MSPFFSVILSTYNSELWLKKVLLGFAQQSFKDFELIIADDGSRSSTKDLIENIRQILFYPVQHAWHPDNGFQKTIILNKALNISKGKYIVFTDGDCIPRRDFLETHNKFKAKGSFLSGGYFKLNRSLSNIISEEDIFLQNCFSIRWLRKRGLSISFNNIKIYTCVPISRVLNKLTPTKPTWNGQNSSGWRKDIFSINGFDERMKYEGEDREFGERLINFGIKPKQIRYSAICLHLDHSRGYVDNFSLELNNKIRLETKKKYRIWSDYGLIKKS